MKLRYKIDQMPNYEYVVDFEFHKELDGQLVYDGAYEIITVTTWDDFGRLPLTIKPYYYEDINEWLSKNEHLIYSAAEREFGCIVPVKYTCVIGDYI